MQRGERMALWDDFAAPCYCVLGFHVRAMLLTSTTWRTQTFKTIQRNVTQHEEEANGSQNQPVDLQFKRKHNGCVSYLFTKHFTGKQGKNRKYTKQEWLVTKGSTKLPIQKVVNCPKCSAAGTE